MTAKRGDSGPLVPKTNLRRPLTWAWRNIAPGLAICAVLLGLVALMGEAYLRMSAQKFQPSVSTAFDPTVGGLFKPGSEAALTNGLDYWTRQTANRLGFLDREPIPPDQRSGGCHVTLIGDSFVEAQQVSIPEKVQVVLEQDAAKQLPELKLTTSAFGLSDTGQLNQLAFYDRFARDQKPSVVVLVAVKNDFADNSALLQGAIRGRHPHHMPRLFARRADDGRFTPQPVDPDWSRHVLPPPPAARPSAVRGWLLQRSAAYFWIEEHAWRAGLLFGRWWYGKSGSAVGSSAVAYHARMLARDPAFAGLLDGWDPDEKPAFDEIFFEHRLPPAFAEAVVLTGFALDEFVARARRDGFKLVILATQTMTRDDGNNRSFQRMAELARQRGIPIIDLYQRIVAKGGRIAEARFRYDGHWSAQGHRWAAEAILDHLRANPDYCRSH